MYVVRMCAREHIYVDLFVRSEQMQVRTPAQGRTGGHATLCSAAKKALSSNPL